MPVHNDGFENGFIDYEGIGELTVPRDWMPSWVQGDQPGVLHRPEYDAKDRELGHSEVRSGRFAAVFFTISSTHDAVLFRMFGVEPGAYLSASVWCMKDRAAMGHGMRIGIDPAGGTDHRGADVLWSEWYSEYSPDYGVRIWRQRIAEAVAETNEITVFLHSKVDNAADCAAAHWDDFVMLEEPPEPEPPEPGPDTSRHVYELYIDGDLIGSGDFHGQAIGWEFWPAETEPAPTEAQQGGGVLGVIHRWFGKQWSN